MSTINGQDLLGSGGHTWVWGQRDQTSKTLGAAGIDGVWGFVVSNGACGGVICGHNGGPALLKGTDQADLTAQEKAICDLIDSGAAGAWADDQGRSGVYLVIKAYRRAGPRKVAGSGAVWQYYWLTVEDRMGSLDT